MFPKNGGDLCAHHSTLIFPKIIHPRTRKFSAPLMVYVRTPFLSPRRESVANPCRIRILWGECRTDGASRRPYFWRKFEFRILAVFEGFEPSEGFDPLNT